MRFVQTPIQMTPDELSSPPSAPPPWPPSLYPSQLSGLRNSTSISWHSQSQTSPCKMLKRLSVATSHGPEEFSLLSPYPLQLAHVDLTQYSFLTSDLLHATSVDLIEHSWDGNIVLKKIMGKMKKAQEGVKTRSGLTDHNNNWLPSVGCRTIIS